MIRHLLLSAALLAPVAQAATAETRSFEAEACRLQATPIATGLRNPWGLAFLPGSDRLLVTERPGGLVLIDRASGTVGRLGGLPEIYASGQGGLLDVALAPDFASSRLVYLTYSQPRSGGAATAIGRGRLSTAGAARLDDFETIFQMNRGSRGGRHFGSRLAFAEDGTLFVTFGDRGDSDRAQDWDDHAGSVIRINPDGSIPSDNPYVGREGDDALWSIGHRNPQGMTIDPATGTLWTVEHGARGGDEINRPQPGQNYGWPVISYGTHYSGAKIGVGEEAPGFQQPDWYWDPSIAPSGLAVVRSPLFPAWNGDLLAGALKFQLVSRLDVEDGEITGEERLFSRAFGRIRDVRIGPDGAIWLLTDERNGQVIRVTPGPGETC